LAILHPRNGVTCALGLNPNRAGDWAPVSIFQDSNGLQHQMGLLRDAVPSLGAPADRRSRDLRGRRPKGAARGSSGKYRHGSRAHLLEPGRVHRRVSLAETSAALGRRLSPFHSADRDGHCRGWRGGQPDARRRRCLRRCAGRAGRRGADRDPGSRGCRRVGGRKLDETALAGLDQAARRACKPIDDKRGTIEYRTKVAGVLARRTATIAYERAGERR
jgi:hypothetical protein